MGCSLPSARARSLDAASMLLQGAPVRTASATSREGTPLSRPVSARRQLLAGLCAIGIAEGLWPGRALADGAPANVWLSGRSDPLRPTSKDKPDGTKKDPKYLSCLNDCIPRVQGPPGSPAKERLDAMEECQIECCMSYQQCTYKVRRE